MCIPELLRTQDYARQVERRKRRSVYATDEYMYLDRRLELTASRQNVVFRGDHPPQLSVILDEAVLRRRIAGVNQMAEQLDHLRARQSVPNIDIRVVRFSDSPSVDISGAFAIHTFPDPADREILHVQDQLADVVSRDDVALVDSYTKAFHWMWESTAPLDTVLDEVLADLENS